MMQIAPGNLLLNSGSYTRGRAVDSGCVICASIRATRAG